MKINNICTDKNNNITMINYVFLDTHHYINSSARFGVNSTNVSKYYVKKQSWKPPQKTSSSS